MRRTARCCWLGFAILLVTLVAPTIFAEKVVRVSLVLHERSMDVTIQYPATGGQYAGDNWAYIFPEFWGGVGPYRDAFHDIETTDGFGKVEKIPSLPPEGRAVVVKREGHAMSFKYSVVCARPPLNGSRSDLCYPAIYPEWACVWGFSFLLLPWPYEFDRFSVTLSSDHFTDVYTTFPQKTVISLWDLEESLIVAGDFRRSTSTLAADSLTMRMFARGDFVAPDSAFLAMIQKIVLAQKTYFGGYPYAELSVILRPGAPTANGGTVTGHGLYLHPDPKQPTSNSELLQAAAAGHFAVWDSLVPVNFDKGWSYFHWYYRGFRSYYGILTPLREGLVAPDTALAAFNANLQAYCIHPAALSVRANDLDDHYGGDTRLVDLPVVKGFGLALLLDMAIRSATNEKRSLDDLVRGLMAAARTRKGKKLDDRDFIQVLETITGQKWKDQYAALVLGAEALPLRTSLQAYGFATKEEERPIANLGFSLNGSTMDRSRMVMAVEKGSPADSIGIHVGDTVVSVNFMKDNPNATARVKIEHAGLSRQYEYLPRTHRTIVQIVPDSASMAALARLAIRPIVADQ